MHEVGGELELSEVEASVGDVVGRLIEFWGFKRNMGRLWTILYLSSEPRSAEDLKQLLKLSSGAVSMLITDLSRWGVVKRVWVQGERREFFAAETNLWKMISRVLSERESLEIAQALATFEEALQKVEARPETQASRLQRERLQALIQFGKLGEKLLQLVVRAPSLDPLAVMHAARVAVEARLPSRRPRS
jgi:HTH-type transcriptional regulator, glycine betaine synthesis regulator